MKIRPIWDALKELFTFRRSEQRAVLWLIPVLGVLAWIIAAGEHPRFEESLFLLADAGDTTSVSENAYRNEGYGYPTDAGRTEQNVKQTGELFRFDPNTVTYEQLRRLGFSKQEAAGIIRFRARGKVFGIPEDFAACYQVSDSMYAQLKPYLYISEPYRLRPTLRNTSTADAVPVPSGRLSGAHASDTLFPFDPSTLDEAGFIRLGFTEKQANVILNYRKARGGFRTPEEFAACYVVSAERYRELLPHIRIEPVPGPEKIDLNSADSALLVSVRGIGPATALAILTYREKLGGFHCPEQLADLRMVTERNYESILEQITIDTCKIEKININFAPAKLLEKHPYITSKTLRRLLKNRKLKGGWRTAEEMIEDNTLSVEEARRLAPYLCFDRDKNR